MNYKASSGQSRTHKEIMAMQDGPKKKFWLIVAVNRRFGESASNKAKKLSCPDIVDTFFA